MLKVPMFKEEHGYLLIDDRIKIVKSGSNRFLSFSVIKSVPEFIFCCSMGALLCLNGFHLSHYDWNFSIVLKKLNKDKLGPYLDYWLICWQIDSFLKTREIYIMWSFSLDEKLACSKMN